MSVSSFDAAAKLSIGLGTPILGLILLGLAYWQNKKSA